MLQWLGNHAAEIIAICAFAFTAYQAYVQRRHNVISVKPHITTLVDRSRNDNTGKLSFIIMNNGLGPAFIDRFQAYMSGEPCDAMAAVESLLEGYKANTSVTTLGDDYAMPSGEARTLSAVAFPCKSRSELEEIAEHLDKLDLELHYSSAYGEKFLYDGRESPKIRVRDLGVK